MSSIIPKLDKLYDTSSIISNITDHDYFHYILFFLFIFIIIYLAVKVEIGINHKNWHEMKCDPKYVFFSGYLRNNGNNSAYEETIKNYEECSSRSAGKVIDEIEQERKVDIVYKDTYMMGHKKMFDEALISTKNEIELGKKEIVQNIDIDLNDHGKQYYNQLKLLGSYVDQVDGVINYMKEYIRGYLSFLYVKYERLGNMESSKNNVKQILDDHFDGILM